jgi:hypothetical protein
MALMIGFKVKWFIYWIDWAMRFDALNASCMSYLS